MRFHATLRDGRSVLVRTVAPADAERLQAFVRALSWQSRQERFFAPVAELTPAHLRILLGAPGLSLAAFDEAGAIVAHAQYALGDGEAEFAVVVAESWRANGLGERLSAALMEHARGAGVKVFAGLTGAGNRAMQRLAAKLGLRAGHDRDPTLRRLSAQIA